MHQQQENLKQIQTTKPAKVLETQLHFENPIEKVWILYVSVEHKKQSRYL